MRERNVFAHFFVYTLTVASRASGMLESGIRDLSLKLHSIIATWRHPSNLDSPRVFEYKSNKVLRSSAMKHNRAPHNQDT